ncbi:MAG: hypothetical protein ACI311_00330 [Bacilli bacterium]
MKKILKFIIVILFCSIFVSSIFVATETAQNETYNNQDITIVINDFEDDVENNSVVDDGIYINDTDSTTIDTNDSELNKSVVSIGNFITNIIKKIIELIANIVSKFVN